MTVRIPLSKGRVALVDDADAASVIAVGKWSACIKPKTVYAIRNVRRADGGWTTTRMHNFITGWTFVDHINGDGLDNRRCNLRPANKSTNAQNVGMRSHNTSGFKGVVWHKAAKRWMAQIGADGEHHYLGLFDDPIEAARAYDAAAIEMHGEFAYLNFPKELSA